MSWGKCHNIGTGIEPDERATCPLELVHCDLAGPVDPTAKYGFRYALSFVDDYSGVNMVYFLKTKSDTTVATERFLADRPTLNRCYNPRTRKTRYEAVTFGQ